VKTHQVLTIAGMDVESSADVATSTTSVTGKPDADGTIRIRETIDAITAHLSLPGDMKVDFDSDKPDAKNDNPDLQSLIDLWRALKGASYTVVLDKDHKLTGIEGAEQLLAKAPAGLAAAIKSRVSQENLKRDVDRARKVLPDKPVNKGDRWQRTEVMDIGAGQKLTFQAYYQYAGTVEKDGKTFDKIDSFVGEVTYSLDPDSPLPLKLVKSDLKVDSSTGAVLFDREKGQVVNTTSTTRITGPITFSVNGQELPGKVDLTLDTGAAASRMRRLVRATVFSGRRVTARPPRCRE
jgi:hypothetical protein